MLTLLKCIFCSLVGKYSPEEIDSSIVTPEGYTYIIASGKFSQTVYVCDPDDQPLTTSKGNRIIFDSIDEATAYVSSSNRL